MSIKTKREDQRFAASGCCIFQVQITPRAESGVLRGGRSLTTEELKALWDGFDCNAEPGAPGYFWPENAPHIEDIHRLLNERAEGEYCAV